MFIKIMFNLFKNNNISLIEKKFKTMTDNLKQSFANIREDIDLVYEKLDELNIEDKRIKQLFLQQNQKFIEIQKQINEITYNLDNIINFEQEKVLNPEMGVGQPKKSQAFVGALKDLHGVAEKIFSGICALSIEKGEWISYEDIAHELYPSKPYDSVRSTISEYIGLLVDMNLVIRKRRGKRAAISLSENAKPILEQLKPRIKPLHQTVSRRNKKV